MIFIGGRFISAEHINSIDVQRINHSNVLHQVIVYTTGNASAFGQGKSDVMDEEMALELRKRIVDAIRAYKASGMKYTIQFVDIPKYEEVHPESKSESKSESEKS